jgi:hypothetical protein
MMPNKFDRALQVAVTWFFFCLGILALAMAYWFGR